MSESTIAVARQANTAFIRVSGKGSFKNAKLLKSFSDTVREEGCDRFVVDLRNCKHMDSTFMGVLAGLAASQKKARLEAPKITNLSPRNRELLETLGLDNVLILTERDTENPDSDYQFLDQTSPEDKRDSAELMLEAHQKLIEADERNASKFQDVVKFLRHKLDS